jgi:fatty acid hydroxylase family protein
VAPRTGPASPVTLVSVVTPTLNEAATLGERARELALQEPPWEWNRRGRGQSRRDARARAVARGSRHREPDLTHRVPFLWRFHRVHHADRDLDVTTALRFHFGEMALSVPFRAAQVALIGVSPRALSIWKAALLASIMFHHSNVRLPARIDRALSRLVMTPRLHGIHHARDPRLRETNWSSGLVVWDTLHGTLLRDAPQPTIGVPGLEGSEDVRLGRMMALPFRERRLAQTLLP